MVIQTLGLNDKSWMASKLFEESVRELQSKYDVIKRKIAFITDNCMAHGENLEWIEIIFLPPNTTSYTQYTQYMDQGVTYALTVKY